MFGISIQLILFLSLFINFLSSLLFLTMVCFLSWITSSLMTIHTDKEAWSEASSSNTCHILSYIFLHLSLSLATNNSLLLSLLFSIFIHVQLPVYHGVTGLSLPSMLYSLAHIPFLPSILNLLSFATLLLLILLLLPSLSLLLL